MENAVNQFKERTESKIRGLRCPDHHQPPRLQFHGSSLKNINIQMSACCAKLISLANQRIAGKSDF